MGGSLGEGLDFQANDALSSTYGKETSGGKGGIRSSFDWRYSSQIDIDM